MNKPNGIDMPMGKEAEPQSATSRANPPGHQGSASFSIVAWMRRFRQLDWADRLNLILAAILGFALVGVLSPVLLICWICMQLAKHRHSLEASSPPES